MWFTSTSHPLIRIQCLTQALLHWRGNNLWSTGIQPLGPHRSREWRWCSIDSSMQPLVFPCTATKWTDWDCLQFHYTARGRCAGKSSKGPQPHSQDLSGVSEVAPSLIKPSYQYKIQIPLLIRIPASNFYPLTVFCSCYRQVIIMTRVQLIHRYIWYDDEAAYTAIHLLFCGPRSLLLSPWHLDNIYSNSLICCLPLTKRKEERSIRRPLLGFQHRPITSVP